MRFDDALNWLVREQDGEMMFYDYIVLLVKTLRSENLLDPTLPISKTCTKALDQRKLAVQSEDPSVPPIMLHLQYVDGDFSVEVVDTRQPSQRKIFRNTVSETIFDEIVDFIKKIQVQDLEDAENPEPEPMEGEENPQPKDEEGQQPPTSSALPTKQQPVPPPPPAA